MKIIKQDMKTGTLTVLPESLDDLWSLSQIITSGDTIKGKTERKIKREGAHETKKMTMTLSINAEKIELTEIELRVTGTTTEDQEEVPKGSHHTIEIMSGEPITITKKKWLTLQLTQLKDATTQQEPKIIMCLIDREEAKIAKLTRNSYEILATLKGESEKKREGTKSKDFFPEAIQEITTTAQRYNPNNIIIASPAFWKSTLTKLAEKNPLKNKMIFTTCSSTEETAFKEILEKEEVKNALSNVRIAKEQNAVEELFKRIAKEGKATYGWNEVKKASEQGAIEQLLITTKLVNKFREKNNFKELDETLTIAATSKGTIIFISSDNEAGKRLDGLGGIAALLRYREV